ncbi:NADH:ubiquinone oxidoreductase subunit NDUFA12 [Candidatus Liberibacter americanus]|uniref:NADH:ubiquinone oxidoreductase 17.2 kD subunit n=1 Tax=Candidatus Liberibacter americanus str. Sao Paulo TaxID=1261131 RepID=U6B5A5_9HYPH|nr:NADH:ubiquinone oxidoreductase subunit NDUFA12 [Candidatus Liberibacter americanus]AHA28234.1 NADH:ubiquinone oxidoreductase 17.2 kD subunit [Candidatus Liberibacter americanus str. Sao Paulo]EMS36252.1 NADH dehydrogenase [Candidatus Liberibacter americanus PW_SP]
MRDFLLQFFTWWNGQTLGTRLFTWRFGRYVGKDEFGNKYYEGNKTSYNLPRRWVIYSGYADPSSIPPIWHGWIHHRRIDFPENHEHKNIFDWQKSHRLNATGSPDAYCPNKSKNCQDIGYRLTGEYKAWSPD